MVIVGDGKYEIPENLAYTIQHVYINPENGKIGLNQLGLDFIGKAKDIDFLKKDKVEKGKPIISIELENGMLTLNSPVTGNIEQINDEVLTFWPDDTYDRGYLLKVQPSDLEQDMADLIKGDQIKEWAEKEAIIVARKIFNFKIIEIGDSNVGKTAMKVRFTDDYFKKDLKSTLGVDFGVKTLHFDHYKTEPSPGVDRITAKMNVWDTGGQEAYGGIRRMYYLEAKGCLVVYDVTNPESLKNIPKWIDELYKNVGKIPALIVGNKIDLKRKVPRKVAEEYATQNGYIYVETSAKTGENVEHAFTELARLIYAGIREKFDYKI